MNRLQKKCLIATVAMHLFLVLVVLFGAAFFVSHPKPDETQVLNVIPANLIDAAFNSGVKNAQPPAPTPPTPPQPVQQPPTPPQPPQPKPVPVKQPDPEPVKPTPTLVEKMEKIFEPKPKELTPDDLTPKETTAKPKEHKIQVDLKQVTRKTPKVNTTDTSAEDDAKAAKLAAKKRAAAFAAAARSIEQNASSATTVEMPGTGSVSYANYASVIQSIYQREWRMPNDVSNDDANTRVSVTIGCDGSVISSRIITPSGDSAVDRSVQETLDRVTFIAPFPDGAKEKQKTFFVTFNLKSKRMLG
jgi:periplasmic protein TonB